jgi:DNA-binding Lrp family transcriptional regulator
MIDRDILIHMRFDERKTLKEIGEYFGVSKQDVQQVLKRMGKNGCVKEKKYRIKKYPPLKERFWNRVNKKDTNDCWEWTASLSGTVSYTHRYGIMRWKTEREYAHRIAWMITYGDIPKGLQVCHSCDNPKCCNPNHLWLGTMSDNIHDRDKKGRGNGGRHKKKLLS